MKMKSVSFFLVATLVSASLARAESIHLGKIQFVANTNVKMFKFTGEAKDMTSKVVRAGGGLQSFEFTIPVAQIRTGMEVRDKHMYERIFTAADGKLPDLTYQSSKVDCKALEGGVQTCAITGKLTFRGETKEFPITAIVKNGSEVSGKASVDVLQFGVKPEVLKYAKIVVENQVALDFEVKLQ
jgi:polyisoprenoid-binding protein YceI